MSWKSRIGLVVTLMGISMGAVLVFLIVLFGLAQTQAGKRQIAAVAERALSKGLEGEVTIGKLEGLIPFSIRLDHLSVADEGGSWLTVEHAILSWSARSLMRGRFHIRELGAAAIKLIRVPQGRDVKKATRTRPPGWLKAVPLLVVDKIAVGRLALGQEVLGSSAVFSLKGRIMAFDPVDLTAKAEAVLEIRDLMSLSNLLGVELPGKTRLHASLKGNGKTSSFSARIRGELNIAGQHSSLLTSILSPEVVYAADIEMTDGKKLTISDLVLEAPAAKLTADASFDFSSKGISGHWDLSVPQLRALSQTLKHPAGGSLRVDGEIGGSLETARLTMKATGHDILVGGINLQEIGIFFLVEDLPARPKGILKLDLGQAEHRLCGSTNFILKDRHISLSPVSVKGCGSELAGNLSVDLDRQLAEGDLEATCKDLSAFSDFLGEKIGGNANVHVHFEPSGATQNVTFQVVGTNLATPVGHASEVRLGARLADVFEAVQGTAEVEIKAFHDNELTLSKVVLTASGDPKDMTFKGQLRGYYESAFEIEAQGALRVSGQGEWIELKGLKGRYGEFPVALARPVAFQHTSKGYSFDKLALNLGPGSLKASGTLLDEQLNLTVDLEGLPLRDLCFAGTPDFAVSMSGHLVATGRLDQPEGRAEIRLIRPQLGDSDFPVGNLAAEATLRQGRFCAKLCLEGLAEKPMEASLDLPVALSLAPFTFSLPGKGALKGHLVGGADLALMSPFFALDDQVLEGHLDVVCALDGTVAEPEVTGQAHLRKGGYENARNGMILRDVDVKLTTKDSRLVVEQAQGTDGEDGIISLDGWVDLYPDKAFPLQLDLILEDAILLRLDEVTATASGHLTLSGSLREQLVAGKLEVCPVEIRIPDRLPPEMTELEIIEIDEDGKEEQQPPTKPSSCSSLTFDVALESPRRVFVRGHGLDAECKAAFRITGSDHEPVITGSVSVVRGYCNFLGKRFSLNEGFVSFDGTVPPVPRLDVRGEAKADDMTAILRVSGLLSAPEVSLTSDPALPEDEVLSRLLFGQSVAAITPMQAVQLAYAVRTMAGAGGGFDPIGSARDFLGVDQLEIKQSAEEDGEISIGAGKYLSDRVYVEVEQGLDSGSTRGTLEVGVTPNIMVETHIGSDLDSGIGVKWKMDY